jgi:hypothetical protein
LLDEAFYVLVLRHHVGQDGPLHRIRACPDEPASVRRRTRTHGVYGAEPWAQTLPRIPEG